MLPRLTQRSGTVPQTNAQDPQQPKSAWDYYLDMARIDDAEQEREITEQVDTQLVFAGLFAAFLSAFLIETLKRLEEDSSATLLDVMIYQTQMMRNETLPPYHREPFAPSPRIVIVNSLFFASLTFILLVAFIAMLAKGWIREFDRGLAAIAKPRRRALVREYRYLGLERWKFVEIVHFLPVLVYISLFLFFCGLSLFLFDIEKACGFVVATTFALGALFYITTTTIATLDDSAPFRSPLSRALGFQFRRLYSLHLHRPNLWRLCLRRAAKTDYRRRRFIRSLFYRLARMARWRPFSEAGFRDQDSNMVLDEQDINVSYAAIERLRKGSPDEGELYRSILLAGHPAHMPRFWHSYTLLSGCARSSDEMTLEAARAVGLLICSTKDIHLTGDFLPLNVNNVLPVLARSSQAWDLLLACFIEKLLSEDQRGFRSLHSSINQILEAIHVMECNPDRILLIVRFLGYNVRCYAEPEEKAAAVRILSTLLLAHPLGFSDQLVHTILYLFVVINDIPFPDTNLNSPLFEFPSFPYIAYNPGVVSQVITQTQWRPQNASVILACREFGRTVVEHIWNMSTLPGRLDAHILHELPRSQLEEYALDPPSGFFDGLIFVYLLLEALISDSAIPRSEFPAVDKEDLDLTKVLGLYDSYLIQCNAMPSLHLQNLLSLRDDVYLTLNWTLEVHHPWLALHTYTLMSKDIPHELIPALKWSDTPALDMIACDRLKLYDCFLDDVPPCHLPYDHPGRPESALLSLFLSSTTYETVLKAFKWYLNLTTRPCHIHQDQYSEPPTTLAFDRIIPILFGSTLDENQITSSWTLILESLMLLWPCLPNEMKHGFVREFFRPEIDMQNPPSSANTCLGIAWFEQLWSTVLASLADSVCIDAVYFARHYCESFDRNTGWNGTVEMEAENEAYRMRLHNKKRKRREERQQERARRNWLLRSVDEVLSVLATLLEVAGEAGLLSLRAVAHLQASPLLLHPRLLQDAASVRVIRELIEYYRPCLCPLPDVIPDEAEMPFDARAIDPTI